MGIRFRCPSGHKLHVKDFLAGKRGICPKCGAKFQIPEQSEPDLVKGSKRGDAVDQPKAPSPKPLVEQDSVPDSTGEPSPVVDSRQPTVGEMPVIDVTAKTEAPRAAEAEAKAQPRVGPAPADASQAHAAPAGKSVDFPDVTASSTGESTGTALGEDPINEAPHAVWYVRPPSGGQFGPASGDVMRSWITEGRVTLDSLVWREGWSEWKSAGGTFPGLLEPNSKPTAEIPQIVTEPSGGTSSEIYRRRKSTKMTLSVVMLLIAACVILFGALVYVVKFMN